MILQCVIFIHIICLQGETLYLVYSENKIVLQQVPTVHLFNISNKILKFLLKQNACEFCII